MNSCKRILWSLFYVFATSFCCLASCAKPLAETPVKEDLKEPFRVIGYFKGDLVTDLPRVNFEAVTHINVAFLNPDSSGKFSPVAGLKAFVAKAHKSKVKVLASLAGGKAPAYYKSLISPSKRTQFIEEINVLAETYKLDGIDVDLEGEMITADYESFIHELSASLKPGILLTAAVATEFAKSVPQGALAKLDFVNIMSYDKTGPWRPSKPGQHSPYEMAADDITYWHHIKGVPKHKINVGLPFYGHSFKGNTGTSFTYNRIVTDYPGAEYKDEIQMKDGSIVYYNGISTIRKKTALALNETGGVMIWQILQDASGEKSLLTLISNIIETAAKAKR